MAKQANNTVIGGFVVLAVFLLIASVVIFGSGNLFKHVDKYILNFDGSIKGLNVGAPVLYEGVKIGTVTDITVILDETSLETNIQVFAEVDPDRFKIIHSVSTQATVPKLIDKGLRGVLKIQSLVTGQLLVQLEYHPGTPKKMKGGDSAYMEIPTTASGTRKILNSLQNLDIDGLVKKLEGVLSSLDGLLSSPAIVSGITSLDATVADFNKLISHIDVHVDPLATSLQGAIGDTSQLLSSIDKQVVPVATDLQKTMVDIDKLVKNTDIRLKRITTNLDTTLSKMSGTVSEDSLLVIKLEDTLSDISAMAASIRQLADYLERHPEALLKGKSRQ